MDKLFGNYAIWINAIWKISGNMKNYDGSIFLKWQFYIKNSEVNETFLRICIELKFCSVILDQVYIIRV